jgi:hypothetical protein
MQATAKVTLISPMSAYAQRSSLPDLSYALRNAGFHEVSSGGDLELLVPQDRGVFDELEILGDLPLVSPIQIYLDLCKGPERGRLFAEKWRKEHLTQLLEG